MNGTPGRCRPAVGVRRFIDRRVARLIELVKRWTAAEDAAADRPADDHARAAVERLRRQVDAATTEIIEWPPPAAAEGGGP